MKTLGRWLGRLVPQRAPGPDEPRHIAFGTFCHVAAGLRRADLRRWTGPFDWIFSSPSMLARCLDDRCASLLDPRYLESVPPEAREHGAKRQCRHRLFEEAYGLPTLFNHHDPKGSAEDRASLERAVARLVAALEGEGSNRLYMMSERPWPIEELEELMGRLRGFPSRNVLNVIELDGRGHRRQVDRAPFAAGTPDLVRVRLFTSTRSLGAKFPDPEDDAFLARSLRTIASPPRDG